MTPVAATRSVSIMVTRRCNMACAHCSVESNPRVADPDPTLEELLDRVRQAAAAGVGSILVTGGEPMIRRPEVLAVLEESRAACMKNSMTTNGFWGRTPDGSREVLDALLKAGLDALTVSYDRYHAEFQGPEPVLHIAAAAADRGMAMNVNVTRVADDEDLEALVAPFRRSANVRIRFYDVQPVGMARHLPPESLRGEVEGFCSACSNAAITDDGRVMACNGPSYFVDPDHPLHVGSLRETPMAELLERHREDPILDTIRTFGPGRLRAELEAAPDAVGFRARDRYMGMCDLCHHVTSDPEAVAFLRRRLSEPGPRVERAGAAVVIESQKREDGVFNPTVVNGPGAARVLLHVATSGGRWPSDAGKTLGRADLDWNRQADGVVRCGLARPLLPALETDELGRWAPSFFARRVREAAHAEARRATVVRTTLRRLDDALTGIGARGVALKGAVGIARHAGEGIPPRSTGDVDLLVAEPVAARLRDALLELGFEGDPAELRTGPHHLAPVSFRGMSVEIHTRVMPAIWGLPEERMLERARPLDGGAGWRSLDALDAEGFVLHAVTHSTAHLYVDGLKTGWDVKRSVEGAGTIDWDRLAEWVGVCRMPRAFWTPARVLARALGVPLPASFLDRAPADRRQRKLEAIAAARLFVARENAWEINPFSKNAVLLLHHDRWLGRARHLAGLISGGAVEARRSALAKGRGRPTLERLGEALDQYRRFRRATANVR